MTLVEVMQHMNNWNYDLKQVMEQINSFTDTQYFHFRLIILLIRSLWELKRKKSILCTLKK